MNISIVCEHLCITRANKKDENSSFLILTNMLYGRCRKWGITNAMVAADILCDLVQGKPNPYAAVFDPSRTILHPQLAVNAFESAVGLLTPTAPRCPHLGCALKYNKAEHTWECPCHGSRFTDHGELIDNPATDDKRM